MFSLLAAIALLSSDPGPSQHFEAFSKALEERGLEYYHHTQGTPLREGTSHLITDLSERSLETLTTHPPRKGIRIFAYYDNPQLALPKEYFETANQVVALAEKVLFANVHLANQKVFSKRSVGIGYSPLPEQAKHLREMRTKASRHTFFEKHSLVDRGQKIAIYFGGATQTHKLYALPHFLHLLGVVEQIELQNGAQIYS